MRQESVLFLGCNRERNTKLSGAQSSMSDSETTFIYSELIKTHMLSAPRQLEIFIPCLFVICFFTICPLQSTLFNLPLAIFTFQSTPCLLAVCAFVVCPFAICPFAICLLQFAPLQPVSCNLPLAIDAYNLLLAIFPFQSTPCFQAAPLQYTLFAICPFAICPFAVCPFVFCLFQSTPCNVPLACNLPLESLYF